MRERHVALDMADDEGLDIAEALSAGRGLADMTDRHVPRPQCGKTFFREHLMDQSVALVVGKDPVVVHDDPTSFLPSVLKRIEGKVNRVCDILGRRFEQAEDAALFMEFIQHVHSRMMPCSAHSARISSGQSAHCTSPMCAFSRSSIHMRD